MVRRSGRGAEGAAGADGRGARVRRGVQGKWRWRAAVLMGKAVADVGNEASAWMGAGVEAAASDLRAGVAGLNRRAAEGRRGH